MLTIRKPIELRTQKPMQGLRQDMAERMMANYGLMNMSIRKEEMLHVTSEPPEVYFAEGDNLQFFNNIKNENQQEIRLDVINNLINRIMVSQTENFTYQDTVYISSVLRRLGIRDEKLFMKQVFALQNEHKETKQLLQNYENNQEILKKFFVEQQEMRKAAEKKDETQTERERRYYMHDEIYQRLETGKIYQDMRQFNKGNRHESQQIFRTEMQLGEQATLEQNFLLQNLKQNITNHPAPLYYCHNNQYEYLQEISENITESLEEQMSAAILLNIVDQTYALRQDQIEENSHYWYSLAGALFQTAENTWRRYESNLLERKFVSNDMLQVLDQVNQIKHLENTTIQNIADEYVKMEEAWNIAVNTQNQFIQNQMQMNLTDEVNVSGGSYHLTQEELELQYLEQIETVENEETAITVEQLQKQLEVFNQQNYENYLKLEQISKEHPQVKDRKLNRKKAQRDVLRALEHSDEVLKEYLTVEVHDPLVESQKEFQTQMYDMFSDETKEIYRQFLLQNHTTEETLLQYIMNQPEEHAILESVTSSLKKEEYQNVLNEIKIERKDDIQLIQPMTIELTNEQLRQQIEILNTIQSPEIYEIWTNPEEVIRRIEKEERLLVKQMNEQHEILRQQSEVILNDSSAVLSEETMKILEKVILQHPEDLLEEELESMSEYKDALQSLVKGTEGTILKEELITTLEYVEKQEFFKQIRKQINVLNKLESSNVYAQWTNPKELILQVEQEEKVLTEQIHKQQEIIRYQSERILKDSNMTISEEMWKFLERLTFVHPEEISESEDLLEDGEYRTILERVMHETEVTEIRTEIEKLFEYIEKQKLFEQIRQFTVKNTEQVQPVIYETMDQKIKQQMQVIEHLQTDTLYEKWTMPADMIWKIEQEEAERIEESILKQRNVETQLKRQQTEQSVVFNQMKKEEIFQTIDFVHKVEEQFLNEELLEEIRMQKQTTQREEHMEQITSEHKTIHHQAIQETVNHMQTTQLNQIEELVQKSVKRQIGDLSDQVYGKIEKKLQTERKRRGYF